MQLVEFATLTPSQQEAAAELLVAAFAEHWPEAWPNLAAARETVAECMSEELVAFAALDAQGTLLGWVAAGAMYAKVWEVNVLAVRPDLQRQGIGRTLLLAIEAPLVAKGCLTIFLGSDDEDEMTSLSGIDLFDAPWRHMRDIVDRRGHPFGFYQRCGYVIIGIVPDANGLGKPDILLAKPIGRR